MFKNIQEKTNSTFSQQPRLCTLRRRLPAGLEPRAATLAAPAPEADRLGEGDRPDRRGPRGRHAPGRPLPDRRLDQHRGPLRSAGPDPRHPLDSSLQGGGGAIRLGPGRPQPFALRLKDPGVPSLEERNLTHGDPERLWQQFPELRWSHGLISTQRMPGPQTFQPLPLPHPARELGKKEGIRMPASSVARYIVL